MPKPIGMSIKVEEIAFGKVWSTLDTMPGVISITIEGNGPKAKPNGKATNGNGKTVADLVLETLLAKSPQTKTQLEDYVAHGGKAKTSLPDTIARLKKGKLIRPIGNKGQYKITAAGTKQATTQLEK